MLFARDVLRFKAATKADRAILAKFAIPNPCDARIIWVEHETAWLIRLGTPRLLIWKMPVCQLEDLRERLVATLLEQHDYDFEPTLDEVTPAQAARRDARFLWIKPLLECRPAVFERLSRARLVTARCAELNDRAERLRQVRAEEEGLRPPSPEERVPDRRVINDLLRRYWVHGMTPNAIMPRFDRIGCNARQAQRKRRVGLSRTGAKLSPFVTPTWRGVFERAVTQHYRRNAHKSLKHVWKQVVYDAVSVAKFDRERSEVTVVRDEDKLKGGVPTYRQFMYWYRNSDRYIADQEGRQGSTRFQKNNRAITGSSTSDLFGVGSRFEVDATMLDVACVSKYNRHRFVGRPTLHLVTDVYSKMIVGFYLGYLDSSWEVAGLALRNVMENKKAFCARFGVEIDEEEWPVSGCLPNRILGDRGEYEGYNATDFVAKTGVTVEVTPPYRGDMKGTVERRFGMIHQLIRSELPGSVAKNQAEKGELDYRRSAILNLDELTEIIIRTILFLNNKHSLESYRRSRAMAEDRVSPIPRDMWNWALRTGRQQLRRVRSDRMNMLVLPERKATLTGEGLVFKRLRYQSEWVSQNNLATLKRTGRAKVTPVVSYDPNSTNRVFLHLEDGGFEVCPLSPRDEQFSGMTFAEVDVIRKGDGEDRRKRLAKDILAFGDLQGRLEEIVKGAKAERSDHLRAGSLKNAAQTRNEEKTAERRQRQSDDDELWAKPPPDGSSELDQETDDTALDQKIAANVIAVSEEVPPTHQAGA